MYLKELQIGNVNLKNNILLAPMAGITDLPFRLINIFPSKVIIMIATILSIISGIEYYIKNKKFLTK